MNAPLTPNSSASFETPMLPMPWVERIFQRLHGRFGNPFTDKFRAGRLADNGEDIGIVNAKTIWAEELASYTPDELKAALAARYDFPPSLDEFQRAARPPVDLHALLLVAMRELAHREQRQPEAWPSNRLFWAAQRLAYELRTSTQPEKLLKRFELAWGEAEADAAKPIPQLEPAQALPAPGKTTLPQAEAQRRIAAIAEQLGKVDNTRLWALQIASDPPQFQRASIEAAVKALKTWGYELPQALLERARDLGLGNLVETGAQS